MIEFFVYFDQELQVYRFVTKEKTIEEQAARANVIRSWAAANGYPELKGKAGRLPQQAVIDYFRRQK